MDCGRKANGLGTKNPFPIIEIHAPNMRLGDTFVTEVHINKPYTDETLIRYKIDRKRFHRKWGKTFHVRRFVLCMDPIHMAIAVFKWHEGDGNPFVLKQCKEALKRYWARKQESEGRAVAREVGVICEG